MSEPKRLNKYISETGFCSRRDADRLIDQGCVTVNGLHPEMGTKVTDSDEIKINGKPLKAKPKLVYLAYNKPVGITCTTDSQVRENIVRAVKYKERIFPIGRLDKPSEGLIFLTNEGDIVNKILRAGNNHEKEYVVTVNKPVTERFIKRMAGGLPILDTVTKKCSVTLLDKYRFNIILTQGLNRQIRRMCEYLDYEVTQLKRIRIMNVELGDLKVGQWRHLSEQEMAVINDSIKNSGKTEDKSVDKNKRRSTNKPVTYKNKYNDKGSTTHRHARSSRDTIWQDSSERCDTKPSSVNQHKPHTARSPYDSAEQSNHLQREQREKTNRKGRTDAFGRPIKR